MSLRLDCYAHQIPAIVRKQEMTRHRALLDEARGTACVMLAQGPPRAWGLALDAAVQGLLEALNQGERSAEPLLAAAASALRDLAATLVDPSPLQVHAVMASIQGRTLEVASAGSCRAYLQRGKENRRITGPSDQRGLRLGLTFSKRSERLERGDLLILGPSHIFGAAGVAQMARILDRHERAAARAVARGLLATKDTEQTGGAVIAIRVV